MIAHRHSMVFPTATCADALPSSERSMPSQRLHFDPHLLALLYRRLDYSPVQAGVRELVGRPGRCWH
jgi:hypothetical protein